MTRILSCPSDRKRAGFSAAEGKRRQGITSFRAALFWVIADSGRLSSSSPVRLFEALAGWGHSRKWKTLAVSRRSGFFVPAQKNGPTSSVDGIEIAMTGRGCPRPAARAGMGTREELLRRRICRGVGCGAVFWICCHCDRGHRYCGDRCRQKTQRQQGRDANRAAPAKPGGAARSPRPATGLPGTLPRAA